MDILERESFWTVVIFAIIVLVSFIGVSIDKRLNPWVAGLSLQWWNFFTTEHYLTWLYIRNRITWLTITSAYSAIIALIAYLGFKYSKNK